MKNNMENNLNEVLEERFRLAGERIAQMQTEETTKEEINGWLKKAAAMLTHLFRVYGLVESGELYKLSLAQLKELNEENYGELRGKSYESGYANPAYAEKCMGGEWGGFLSAVYVQLRQGLTFAYGGQKEEFTALAELYLEIANAFGTAWTEEKRLPDYEEIRQIYYWYMSDYTDLTSARQVRELVSPEKNSLYCIATESNLADLRYLYWYGQYVSDCELRTAAFLNSLPEEKIATMADTFTEGYRIGFITTGKDLSKKSSVSIIYNLGFERMIRRAVENFGKLGLASVISNRTVGSTPVNRQYQYDHKDDNVLFFDRQYMARKLESVRQGFEQYKTEARGYAGPAVVEVFGEEPFAPAAKKEALKMSPKEQKLMVEYSSAYRQIQEEYILEEERSFTIIAFPTPEISSRFEEIFDEIIRINTLDYVLYRDIQQKLINVLDTAEYAEVHGMNGNRTDMKVMLHPLQNPDKETKFENCVADVNIPVGEVFTSPVLKGTEGTLHVSRVFLNELEYKDLEIRFKDGMISEYRCGNFEDEEEGKRYIKDNVLMHHDALPIGEFAIGTNTTAYVVAEKYDIGAKLPILIAEKTGPHFAVGDTCYSHVEDVKVYNPDGKEIIARENEVSAKRKEDHAVAYFNCHTDITIPYHELGELAAVRADGSRVVLIKDGRFVLEGCEELNKPFGE